MTAERSDFEREKLPYRQSVAAMVVDPEGWFLLVQKTRYKDNEWEFPGGGIERKPDSEWETPEEAGLREIKEELGTDKVDVVATSRVTNRYEWKEKVINSVGQNTGYWYQGQEQSYVFAKYAGDGNDIRPQAEEIKAIKWVTRDELSDHLVFPNQANKASEVLWDLDAIGAEFYGLGSGKVETSVPTINPPPALKWAMVLDAHGMLRLDIGKYPILDEETYDYFNLPRIFNSVDDLQKRPPLRVWTDRLCDKNKTKDNLAKLIEGFDFYIQLTKPGYRVMTKIKLYEQYESGQNARTEHLVVPAYDMFGSIQEEADRLSKRYSTVWTGGFSGTVWVVPEGGNETIEPVSNGETGPEMPADTMIFPLMDFDIQYSDNPEKETEKIIKILRANGFSGWLAHSGRGLHYIADFLVPRDPGLSQSMGQLALLTLSKAPEFARHREFALRISQAKNLTEARTIAEEILAPGGIPNEDTAAVADIRYVARRVKDGTAILRAIPYWKNPQDYPTVFTHIF